MVNVSFRFFVNLHCQSSEESHTPFESPVDNKLKLTLTCNILPRVKFSALSLTWSFCFPDSFSDVAVLFERVVMDGEEAV